MSQFTTFIQKKAFKVHCFISLMNCQSKKDLFLIPLNHGLNKLKSTIYKNANKKLRYKRVIAFRDNIFLICFSYLAFL